MQGAKVRQSGTSATWTNTCRAYNAQSVLSCTSALLLSHLVKDDLNIGDTVSRSRAIMPTMPLCIQHQLETTLWSFAGRSSQLYWQQTNWLKFQPQLQNSVICGNYLFAGDQTGRAPTCHAFPVSNMSQHKTHV